MWSRGGGISPALNEPGHRSATVGTSYSPPVPRFVLADTSDILGGGLSVPILVIREAANLVSATLNTHGA